MNTPSTADSAAAFPRAASRLDQAASRDVMGFETLAFENVLARLRPAQALALLQPGSCAKRAAELPEDTKRYPEDDALLFALGAIPRSAARLGSREFTGDILNHSCTQKKKRSSVLLVPLHLLNTPLLTSRYLG